MLAASPILAAAVFPGTTWRRADATNLNWSTSRLDDARRYAGEIGSTAVFVVQHGQVVVEWGDVSRRVRVASIRKSLLSALYGIAVAEKRIDPATTLEELGIDDSPPRLTGAEKRATVRDLLMARSGVYHDAVSESRAMQERRPERGSHARGTFWYYNNWDFNALGTIYRQRTGDDIFAAFEQRIARPIGMQDFTAADGRYLYARTSIHPAYHFDLSARDLARFGLLFLQQGSWRGARIVPPDWVAESTRALTPGDTTGPHVGYGYMWWVTTSGSHAGLQSGKGAFSARGYGGQMLLVSPDDALVIVMLHATHITNQQQSRLLGLIGAAKPRGVRLGS